MVTLNYQNIHAMNCNYRQIAILYSDHIQLIKFYSQSLNNYSTTLISRKCICLFAIILNSTENYPVTFLSLNDIRGTHVM